MLQGGYISPKNRPKSATALNGNDLSHRVSAILTFPNSYITSTPLECLEELAFCSCRSLVPYPFVSICKPFEIRNGWYASPGQTRFIRSQESQHKF